MPCYPNGWDETRKVRPGDGKRVVSGPFRPESLRGSRLSTPCVVEKIDGRWQVVRVGESNKASNKAPDTLWVRGQEIPRRKAAG